MIKNISNNELSKTWFKLSNTFAILAGLFFILASLQASSYSDLEYNIDARLKTCDYALNTKYAKAENLTLEQCMSFVDVSISDIIKKKTLMIHLFIFIGFLMALDSFLIWILGRIKLHKREFMDVRWFLILMLMNILFIFLFWFYTFDPFTQILSRQIVIDNRSFNLPVD